VEIIAKAAQTIAESNVINIVARAFFRPKALLLRNLKKWLSKEYPEFPTTLMDTPYVL
jgi:hypothetical protein